MAVYYSEITFNCTLRAASVKAVPGVQRTLTGVLALVLQAFQSVILHL